MQCWHCHETELACSQLVTVQIGMINVLSSTHAQETAPSSAEKSESKFYEILEFPLFWNQWRLDNTGNLSILFLIRWLLAWSSSVLAYAKIRGQIVVYSPCYLRRWEAPNTSLRKALNIRQVQLSLPLQYLIFFKCFTAGTSHWPLKLQFQSLIALITPLISLY